jgi:hypothetical protein
MQTATSEVDQAGEGTAAAGPPFAILELPVVLLPNIAHWPAAASAGAWTSPVDPVKVVVLCLRAVCRRLRDARGTLGGRIYGPGAGSFDSSLCYCIITKIKLFITISCPILVLTTVLGCPRRADVNDGVKNYNGPTTYHRNKIPPYVFFNISVIMT